MNFLNIFDTEGQMTLELVIGALFIGVVIASIAAVYQKQVIGAFVRKLLSEQATGEASALTLTEVGYAKNPFVRQALRDGAPLRKVVTLVDTVPRVEGEKSDVKTAKFFIAEEQSERAEMQYSGQGSTVLTVILSAVIFLAAAVAAVMLIPYLTGLFDGVKETLSHLFS